MNMSRILFRISQKYLRISQLLKTYYLYTKTHTWDFHDIFIIVYFFFLLWSSNLKNHSNYIIVVPQNCSNSILIPRIIFVIFRSLVKREEREIVGFQQQREKLDIDTVLGHQNKRFLCQIVPFDAGSLY
jgi:hypothetical protein